MSVLSSVIWAAVAVLGLIVVVAQHIGYFRRTRPMSFAAFLETAGWIVITLVAGAALGGGMISPNTRVVEIAAAIVGALLIGIGGQFR